MNDSLKPISTDRRTTMVPVTTMEELPVLSAREREELMKSLTEAEERISAGDFVRYDSQSFKDRLQRSYQSAQRQRD